MSAFFITLGLQLDWYGAFSVVCIFIFHGAVNQTWALNILSMPSINPPISTSSELG